MAEKNLAAEILELDDRPVQPVHVPEWRRTLHVRAMSGTERDRFETLMQEQRAAGAVNVRATLVALTVVDEAGNRLFADADVEALGRKSASALNRLFEVSAALSGILSRDVEELEGNSVAPTGGASS